MVAAGCQYGAMRTRKPIPAELLETALRAADGDVQAVAAFFGVSDRTVYRRMKDYGIRVRRHVVVEEAA